MQGVLQGREVVAAHHHPVRFDCTFERHEANKYREELEKCLRRVLAGGFEKRQGVVGPGAVGI